MAQKYLDYQGLVYVWTKIKTLLGGKVDTVTYDTTNKKLTKTIAGATTDVVTASDVVLDGGGVKSVQVGENTAVSPDATGKISLPDFKTKQSAVSDPTADGTGVEFISGISQNANGVITPTKKTVRTMGASGTNHASGLVPDTPSTAGTTKFLREDGTWAVPTYTDISGKADKVSGATAGNFAGLDASGNLTDSGKKAADFADASHVHGNVTNDGKLQTTDVAVANGDKLVVTDASDGNKVARTSVEFDGTTTNKALTPKGTFETFLQEHQDISGKVDKTTTVNGHALSSDVTVTKSDVGLGSVTNDAQVKRTEMGVANGVATLDASGLVPASQLPSYVDDVIEAYARDGQTALTSTWLATGSASGTVITPETGKIYVLMADTTDYAANTQFRWSGTSYVKLADGGVSAITNAEIDAAYAAA